MPLQKCHNFVIKMSLICPFFLVCYCLLPFVNTVWNKWQVQVRCRRAQCKFDAYCGTYLSTSVNTPWWRESTRRLDIRPIRLFLYVHTAWNWKIWGLVRNDRESTNYKHHYKTHSRVYSHFQLSNIWIAKFTPNDC